MPRRLPAGQVVISWRDETGSLSLQRVHTSLLSPAAALAAAGDLAAAVADVSGAAAGAASVNWQYHVTDAPAPGGQVASIQALLVFRCAGDNQYLTMTIPAVKALLIDTAAPNVLIDIAQTHIQNITSFAIANNLCNPFGYPVVELLSAFVQFEP